MGWPGLYLLLDNIDQLGSLCTVGTQLYSFCVIQPKITNLKHIWGECIVYTEIIRKPHLICSNKEPLEAHL